MKTLAILLVTTARRLEDDREHLKAYWKSEKCHLSLGYQQTCYFQRLY